MPFPIYNDVHALCAVYAISLAFNWLFYYFFLEIQNKEIFSSKKFGFFFSSCEEFFSGNPSENKDFCQTKYGNRGFNSTQPPL